MQSLPFTPEPSLAAMQSGTESPAKARLVTLGCKVNQYETQLLRERLFALGFVEAAEEEPADLCVVNTCTVTSEGDRKSRQLIRQLARHNPRAQLMVMGCYATRAPEEISRLPQVSDVITDKRELPDWLLRFGQANLPDGISNFAGHHRAWVKVQDGCMLRCTYCIIPHVRPQLASRPAESICAEVERLSQAGFKEVVLAGIHLGHYGVDQNHHRPKSQWVRLNHLLEKLVQLPGDFRMRLSSIEATEVTKELLRVMADHAGRICPHLHVCLQSGSDRVLRRMCRRWCSQRFVDRCLLAKERLDHPALTTDVIVGFPGETDSDFAATCSVVEQVGFLKVHVFPFSPRRGTPAADFPDQVPADVKAERVTQLIALESKLQERYLHSLVGRQLQLLAEGPSRQSQSGVRGTSCRYATVELPQTQLAAGELVQVRVSHVSLGVLLAEHVAQPAQRV